MPLGERLSKVFTCYLDIATSLPIKFFGIFPLVEPSTYTITLINLINLTYFSTASLKAQWYGTFQTGSMLSSFILSTTSSVL